jgi:hypothetical protein
MPRAGPAGTYLPHRIQEAAELVVGLLIVGLAVWLLVCWRSGALMAQARVRSRATAYGIGLVHGAGGSAGIGILLLAAILQHGLALAGLSLAFGLWYAAAAVGL